MATIQQCEDLATKAELEELREQINQLLGKTEDGNIIDVLEQGNLFNTAINNRLIEDFEIEIDANTGQVQTLFWVGSPGETIEKLVKGAATAGINKLATTAKGSVAVGKLAIDLAFNSDKRAQANEEFWKRIADLIDKNDSLRKTELRLRASTRRAKSVWEALDKNASQTVSPTQDIEEYKQIVAQDKQTLEELKADYIEQENKIKDIEQMDFIQNDAIAKVNQDVADVNDWLIQDTLLDQQFKEDVFNDMSIVESAINDQQSQIDELLEYIELLIARTIDTETDIEDIIDDFSEIEIEQEELIARVIDIEDFLKNDPELLDLSDDEKKTTTPNFFKRVYKNSGGVPINVKNHIVTQKLGTIDIGSQLAGNPETINSPKTGLPINIQEEKEKTYQDILFGDDNFGDLMDALKLKYPDFTTDSSTSNTTETNTETNTETETNTTTQPQVTPQDLENWGIDFKDSFNNDFEATITAIIAGTITPPLNDILNQTKPENITSAASDAICEQADNPSSCLNAKVKKPIMDGMNNGLNQLMRNINTLLNSAILAQGQKILNIVKDTNTVLKRGFQSQLTDKVLNGLNTALLIHNASMLSGQIAETLGDTASIVLNSLGIKDNDDNPIDVNGVVKAKLTKLIEGIVGKQNTKEFLEKLAQANRIYQTGQNIVNDTIDLFDTTHQILEQTGGNVAKIGNALREAGEVDFDAYTEMNEEMIRKSKVFNRLEGIEEKVDTIYSITSDVESIKDTVASLSENREELTEAIDEFKEKKETEEVAREAAIEALE